MIGLGFGNFQAVTQEPFSFGNALQFDGANDYVNFTPISSTSIWTCSFWVKYNSTAGASIIGGSSTPYFGFNVVLNGINFRTNVTSYLVSPSPVTITTSNWFHCLIVQNGSNAFFYINGQSFSSNPVSVVGNFTFEWLGDGINGNLNGVLDEIAIWDGVVGTSQNAIDLYNLGNGQYANSVIPNPDRYYRLDGIAGDSTAIDIGSDLANGTLNNFDTATCWVAH